MTLGEVSGSSETIFTESKSGVKGVRCYKRVNETGSRLDRRSLVEDPRTNLFTSSILENEVGTEVHHVMDLWTSEDGKDQRPRNP